MYKYFYKVNGEIGYMKDLAKKYKFSEPAALAALRSGRNKIKGYPIERIGQDGGVVFSVLNNGKVEFIGTAAEIAEEYLICRSTVYKAAESGWLVQGTWRIRKEGDNK